MDFTRPGCALEQGGRGRGYPSANDGHARTFPGGWNWSGLAPGRTHTAAADGPTGSVVPPVAGDTARSGAGAAIRASAVAKLGDVGANSVAAAPSVPGLPGTPYSREGRMAAWQRAIR